MKFGHAFASCLRARQPLLNAWVLSAATLGLGGCGATLGSIQNPLQQTPVKAPVTVITGWTHAFDIDTPDTALAEGMQQSAQTTLAALNPTLAVQQGMRAALEKQNLSPSMVVAPTVYNTRFDVGPPSEIKQVKSGSVLVVGVQPEMLCVNSVVESVRGTQDPLQLYPCTLAAVKVSVLHHTADGTVDPPLVWREVFKRDMLGSGARCRTLESCVRDGMEGLISTLRSNGLF